MAMTTCPGSCAPAGTEAISVYEAIGGRAALVEAVDSLYGRLLADPELGPFFPGGVGARHRRYVVTILGQALGGPERYRGPMVGAPRGLGISGAHFERAAAHLAATLDGLSIPRHLTDRIVEIVAGLEPAVVTPDVRRRSG
jgi:hemoglobin